jgi:hypothetical protein
MSASEVTQNLSLFFPEKMELHTWGEFEKHVLTTDCECEPVFVMLDNKDDGSSEEKITLVIHRVTELALYGGSPEGMHMQVLTEPV